MYAQATCKGPPVRYVVRVMTVLRSSNLKVSEESHRVDDLPCIWQSRIFPLRSGRLFPFAALRQALVSVITSILGLPKSLAFRPQSIHSDMHNFGGSR